MKTKYTPKHLFLKVLKGYILVTDPKRLLYSPIIELSDNLNYIYWRNYGSSAIRINFKEFTWLLKDIFNGETLYPMKPETYSRIYDLESRKRNPELY